MTELTKGRKRSCKDSIGGVKSLYLMPYVDYNARSIRGDKSGYLTSFPDSVYYEWESEEINFEETNIDYQAFDQEIKFKITKKDLLGLKSILSIVGSRVRAIVVDNLGNTKIVGLRSGMEVSVDSDSGGAKDSFSGYEIVLKGKEERESPFIQSLIAVGLFNSDDLEIGCLLSSTDVLSSNDQFVSSCDSVNIEEFKSYLEYLSSTDRLSSSDELTSKFI